jgi:tRNA(His) guanylyltransferase
LVAKERVAMDRSSIGDRFKRYEQVTDIYLTKRTPVIARVDGRAFHTLTRGLDKPFSIHFFEAMGKAALALCNEIQGCKLAYFQSDEISLLITDYDTIQTEAWFDYRLQKMCSIAAQSANEGFNKEIAFWMGPGRDAQFDARFFNVPENDVVNYFIWRQRDAVRNSLSGFAQSNFSHNELQNKNSADMHEMLHQKGLNWNDLPTIQKQGATVVRSKIGEGWVVDYNIPSFSQNRAYIEDLLPKVGVNA